MACFNCYKRYTLLRKIQRQMDMVNQMGCYRFIGEWGIRLNVRYTSYTNRYNRLRFWWQSDKKSW